MEKHTTVLVGNGFNHFAKNYLNDENNRKDIINQFKKINSYSEKKPFSEDEDIINQTINGITKALNAYCYLLDDISIEEMNHKGEFFLEKLFTFTEMFNVESINNTIEEGIKSKIKFEINDQRYLKDVTGKPIYIDVTLRSIFGVHNQYFSIALHETLKSLTNKSIDIITTNYDKNCKAVFCEVKNSQMNSKGCYKYINYLPIHGCYEDKIVCSAPLDKIKKINPETFKNLTSIISESTTIILFGIGLGSDPHILNLLNEKENCNFIIIDADIQNYIQKNYSDNQNSKERFKFLSNNTIYYIDTNKPTLVNHTVLLPHNTPSRIIEGLKNVVTLINSK